MSSSPVLKDFFRSWVVSQTGTADHTYYAAGDYITYTDSKTGGWNPGWKEDIKNHRSAGTPFAGDRFKWGGSTRGFATSKFIGKSNPNNKMSDRVHGDLMGPEDFGAINLPIDTQMEARVSNGALAKFYSHAWSALRSFQGGVFLGEIREALHMIKRPAKAFRKGLDDYSSEVRRRIRRGVRGRPDASRESSVRANRIASDTWLEYAFGWSPLISDVRSGAEALGRLASAPHEYIKVSARANEEYSVVQNPPFYNRNIAEFTVYRFSRRRRSGYSCWIIGEVKCSVSSPRSMASELLGFTPNDFVPTIWELIPYSFLVDYFTNIGDVISAWSFPRGAIAWQNRSNLKFAEREVMAWPIAPFNPNPGLWTLESYDGTSLHVTQFRSHVTRDQFQLGIPSVSFEIPGSGMKWANIAALANMRRAV